MLKVFFVNRLSLFVHITISCFLLTFYYLPEPVFAQCTIDVASHTANCPASGIIQLQELLTRIISISTTIAFMALTVWLVWSAVKFFITSGGDPKALAHAWGSVTWAFMGIFFMVLAYLVLRLIFVFTGFDVTKFCLGFPPFCAPI